ncbi:chromosomal replication initiator protein DnaA [Desulfobacterota bacterium AH_259_B03_O07]|nr:chromosomal replication initiator protein DnaA [Desulfobacterota bacterium AH_259_B03_O07]
MAKRETLGRNLRSLISDEEREVIGSKVELLLNPSDRANAIPTNRTEEIIKIEWQDVLERIRKKSNPQVFFWFAPLKLASATENSLTLKANSDFERDWIIHHYKDFISETVKEVYSRNLDVKIITETDIRKNLDQTPENTSISRKRQEMLYTGFLNPNYTFDKFIVGPSNQFAHAASTAVASKPAEAYNPLFIYGGVGLGKTHLINAIGNHILKHTSHIARICCISAEHFTNEVINSIKSNKMNEFRNKYRFGCDVLLIDDIQFLIGKESTQEEFFHTFNTLYESKKQVVITSDKSPKDMSYLEERLRSRFEWGLITDIQPPETETRVAIVKKKAESEGVVIPNEVAIFLAQNIISNIRELEGTLINIIGYAKLLNTKITIDLAKEVLKNIIKEQDRRILSIETIQKEVASYFGIRIQDLKSIKKQKNIAKPRQIAMFFARRYTGASFTEIGEKFGGKDHSTVIHAVRKIESLIVDDLAFRNTINAVSRRIEALRSG